MKTVWKMKVVEGISGTISNTVMFTLLGSQKGKKVVEYIVNEIMAERFQHLDKETYLGTGNTGVPNKMNPGSEDDITIKMTKIKNREF